MPTTSRNAYRYPALTDAPNVPQALQNLAEDVEGWTSRAFQCTSSTRPSSPPNGMVILETDTGSLAVFTASAWHYFGATDLAYHEGQWSAAFTPAQSIPNNSETTVAFGTQDFNGGLVTRTTASPGHTFTLNRGGLWSCSTTVRFASSSNAERYVGINTSTGARLGGAGNTPNGTPSTMNVAVTRNLPSGTILKVVVYQNSGGSVALEPADGWCRLNLAWLHG